MMNEGSLIIPNFDLDNCREFEEKIQEALNSKVNDKENQNEMIDENVTMTENIQIQEPIINNLINDNLDEVHFLGKKTNRHPSETAKNLVSKHSLGNMKCQEVILDDDKYSDDIQMIISYADGHHPFQLVIEFCQKFKWSHPEIFTHQTNKNSEDPNEAPIFKTTISVRNNSFYGEAIGATKKISKKKAAIHVITHMLEDNFVRDTMKMFVKGLLYKSTENEKNKIKEHIDPDDEEAFMRIKNEDEPDDEADKERVEKILNEYHLNNPLVKLNFFKNKVKIPFSFTITQRGKMRIVTVYVGSEIFGVGEDRNLKVARYLAAEQGLNKIKKVYGEEILLTKEDRKNIRVYHIKEDIVDEIEKEIHSQNFNPPEIFNQINLLLEDLNKNKNSNQTLQMKFEIFCLKLERNLIPVNDFNEIEKVLAKIFYTNKSISMHFNNPILVGSFSQNCSTHNHKVIDILFDHKMNESNMKNACDSLLKNFNLIFNESIHDPIANIKNKKNETNFDMEVIIPDKDYSFILLIRNLNDNFNKEYVEYLNTHNEMILGYNDSNFYQLRRLMRLWRRKFNLSFIMPELLDWIIIIHKKTSISETLAKIFNKISKDFQNLFKKEKNISSPQIILDMIKNICNSTEDLACLSKSCNDSIILISEGKFDSLFI